MKSLRINTGANRNEVDRTDHIKNFVRTLYDGTPLTKEKENELFREYILTNDSNIKDIIIKSNSRFVYSAAKAFTNDPEEVLDLTMEGMMGMLEAFDKFNPDNGNGFLSFANHYIYKYMVTYTHKSKFVKRSKDHSLKNKSARIKEKFFAENGRYPSDSEIVTLMYEKHGIVIHDESYIRDIVISKLDDYCTFGNGDNVTFMDSQEFTKNDSCSSKNIFENEIETEGVKSTIYEVLSALDNKEKDIIMKLFGIGYDREFTANEIAEEYCMSVSRINQIKKSCLSKMKNYKFAV